jgi:hypothetical protein
MREGLTGIGEADHGGNVEADIAAPVVPGSSAETFSEGAGCAGPRVERAEARQQNRDASSAPVTITVNASELTDFKAFADFLQAAGFSKAFARRAAAGAFKSAAEPSAEDQPIAQVIASLFADASAALKGTRQ